MIKAFTDDYFGKIVLDSVTALRSVIIEHSEDEISTNATGRSLKLEKARTVIKVGKLINSSGLTGCIYECTSRKYGNIVVKLYKEPFCTKFIEQKLKLLTSFECLNPDICWPIDIVRSKEGTFLGYIMKKISGKNLSVFTRPNQLIREFKNITRLDQVKMAISICEQFKYLHDNNIIVGDVKLENIVFDKDNYSTCLCDMDSVQINEFNCEQFSEGYTHQKVIISRGKEIKKVCELVNADNSDKKVFKFYQFYTTFYRTMEIENYALSVLLYRFFMIGLFPYSYKDAKKYPTDEEGEYDEMLGKMWNLRLAVHRIFPYRTNEDLTLKTAVYKEGWSHFPSFVKKAFEDVFLIGKEYKPEDWLKIFTRYKDILEDGTLENIDKDNYNLVLFNKGNIASYKDYTISLLREVSMKDFTVFGAAKKCFIKQGLSSPDELCRRIEEKLSKVYKTTIDDLYEVELVSDNGLFKEVKIKGL